MLSTIIISSYDQFLSKDHCYNIVNHCLQHYQLQPLQLFTATYNVIHILTIYCYSCTYHLPVVTIVQAIDTYMAL